MSKLVRKQHWPSLLHNYIASVISEPFVWGKHDCCLFVADVVQEMTGTDLAIGWRGRYSSEEDLVNIISNTDLGDFTSIVDTLAKQFDLPSIAITFAQRGDVVQFDTKLGPTMGIVIDHRIAAVGLVGLTFHRMENVYNSPSVLAWKI